MNRLITAGAVALALIAGGACVRVTATPTEQRGQFWAEVTPAACED